MLLDAAQAPQGSGYTTLLFFVLMFVVFYFFMIRPQNKKAKKQREFVSKLEKGLKVVTLSGVHGRVDKVNADSTLDLEVNPGVYIKVEKSSISMELSMPLNETAKDGERKK